MARHAAPEATSRGETTRALILETALRLFQERGYEGTTMRAIATAAGVSLGNAYYYFKTKEHLIQAWYARTHEEHLAACEPLLAREQKFAARLRSVLRAKIATSDSHHRFAGQLFRTAADPESPLNPFSEESRATRERAVALFADVARGSDIKVPDDLAKELPRLLWLHEMGVILFWIHDRSAGRERTYRLIDRTCDIVGTLVKLAANPLLKPLRSSALKLVKEIAPS